MIDVCDYVARVAWETQLSGVIASEVTDSLSEDVVSLGKSAQYFLSLPVQVCHLFFFPEASSFPPTISMPSCFHGSTWYRNLCRSAVKCSMYTMTIRTQRCWQFALQETCIYAVRIRGVFAVMAPPLMGAKLTVSHPVSRAL